MLTWIFRFRNQNTKAIIAIIQRNRKIIRSLIVMGNGDDYEEMEDDDEGEEFDTSPMSISTRKRGCSTSKKGNWNPTL